MSAEFFHWLKHTDEGRHAKFEPSQANTVLLPDPREPRLALEPPVGAGPGSGSAHVPAGHVVPTVPSPGWSWHDVQVAVPSVQVARAMARVAHEPLVYLGHPVMVVPTETSGEQGAGGLSLVGPSAEALERLETQHRQHQHWGHDGMYRHQLRTPDQLLNLTNSVVLQHVHCKGLWVAPETFEGQLVNLTHGLRGTVGAWGRLQLLPRNA